MVWGIVSVGDWSINWTLPTLDLRTQLTREELVDKPSDGQECNQDKTLITNHSSLPGNAFVGVVMVELDSFLLFFLCWTWLRTPVPKIRVETFCTELRLQHNHSADKIFSRTRHLPSKCLVLGEIKVILSFKVSTHKLSQNVGKSFSPSSVEP